MVSEGCGFNSGACARDELGQWAFTSEAARDTFLFCFVFIIVMEEVHIMYIENYSSRGNEV